MKNDFYSKPHQSTKLINMLIICILNINKEEKNHFFVLQIYKFISKP